LFNERNILRKNCAGWGSLFFGERFEHGFVAAWFAAVKLYDVLHYFEILAQKMLSISLYLRYKYCEIVHFSPILVPPGAGVHIKSYINFQKWRTSYAFTAAPKPCSSKSVANHSPQPGSLNSRTLSFT
jgi:hypothetical protein